VRGWTRHLEGAVVPHPALLPPPLIFFAAGVVVLVLLQVRMLNVAPRVHVSQRMRRSTVLSSCPVCMISSRNSLLPFASPAYSLRHWPRNMIAPEVGSGQRLSASGSRSLRNIVGCRPASAAVCPHSWCRHHLVGLHALGRRKEGETYGGGMAEPAMMLMRVEHSMLDNVEVGSEVTGRSRRRRVNACRAFSLASLVRMIIL
jgi:hypothetical protein